MCEQLLLAFPAEYTRHFWVIRLDLPMSGGDGIGRTGRVGTLSGANWRRRRWLYQAVGSAGQIGRQDVDVDLFGGFDRTMTEEF